MTAARASAPAPSRGKPQAKNKAKANAQAGSGKSGVVASGSGAWDKDGVHLSKRGYDVLAGIVYSGIAHLL